MHLLLTILRRDLALWPRQPRFYLKRAALGTAFGVLVYAAVLRGAAADATTAGGLVFRHLTLVVGMLACLLSPLAAGRTLAADRHSGAWSLLYLTDVRPGLFVLAKLGTALWRALALLLAALPMFLLSVSLGGVAHGQVLAALAGLTSIVVLGVSIGLCGAVAARSELQAASLILCGALGVFLVLPAATYLLALALGADPLWATRVSPMLGLRALTEGAPLAVGLAGAGTATALALVFLAITFLLTPRRMVASALTPVPRLPRLARWFGRRPLLGSPVHWRDYYLVYGGPAPAWLGCLGACLALVAAITGAQALLGWWDTRGLVALNLTACGALALVVYLFNFTFSAARMFNQERDHGALELLLCTDLRESQIVADKLAALYRAQAPWLLPIAVALGGHLWLARDWRQVGYLVAGALFLAVTWYAYSGLCVYLALRLSRQVEVLALAALALWLTVGLSLFAIVGGYLAAIAFLFGPLFCLGAPLALGLWLRRLTTQHFRHYALAPTA
jgi:hypothetical protein